MPKGYYTSFAYMGYIPSIGKYQQFANEEEYRTYIREVEGICQIIHFSMTLPTMVIQIGREIILPKRLLATHTITYASMSNQKETNSLLKQLRSWDDSLQTIEAKSAQTGYTRLQTESIAINIKK